MNKVKVSQSLSSMMPLAGSYELTHCAIKADGTAAAARTSNNRRIRSRQRALQTTGARRSQ